jgi:hypothetical protein
MQPSAIFESLIASLAAASVIAAIAWLYSWCRNMFLERALKDSINPNGVGVGFRLHPLLAEFTLQIHNYANAAIRVRAVIFVADKFHIELEPEPKRLIFQTPLSNEAIRPKFKRKSLSRAVLQPDNNPHSILLPSKTMSVWRVRPQTIEQHEWIIKRVFVVFEYATIFGNAAMIRVEAKESSFKLIKSEFERLSNAAYHKVPIGDPRGSASEV